MAPAARLVSGAVGQPAQSAPGHKESDMMKKLSLCLGIGVLSFIFGIFGC
jgi:hypothetical protein